MAATASTSQSDGICGIDKFRAAGARRDIGAFASGAQPDLIFAGAIE